MARIHYVLPDVQVRPGDVCDHLDWIALDIIRRKPDVLWCLGDFWDLLSLSRYSPGGSTEKEGSRIKLDLEAGHAAMHRLTAPIFAEQKRMERNRKKRWPLEMEFLEGNHEHRAARFADDDARFEGLVGTHLCEVEQFGWRRHKFLQPVCIDGIWGAHYWQNMGTGKPIGGTIENRLNKLGFSFIAGHEQGKRYAPRALPNGKTIHGLVVGSCYLGEAEYRGPQGVNEWRGVVVLYEVNDGNYEPLPLTLGYLCKRYTGEDLLPYLTRRYPERDWSHFA